MWLLKHTRGGIDAYLFDSDIERQRYVITGPYDSNLKRFTDLDEAERWKSACVVGYGVPRSELTIVQAPPRRLS